MPRAVGHGKFLFVETDYRSGRVYVTSALVGGGGRGVVHRIPPCVAAQAVRTRIDRAIYLRGDGSRCDSFGLEVIKL
jgi:hypothetical protein